MLVFENERTNSIVARLVAVGNTIRLVVILASAILFGALLGFLGLSFWRDAGLIIGAVGLLIGALLGTYIASLFTIVFEWMAQMLVAQGEILAELKRRG